MGGGGDNINFRCRLSRKKGTGSVGGGIMHNQSRDCLQAMPLQQGRLFCMMKKIVGSACYSRFLNVRASS